MISIPILSFFISYNHLLNGKIVQMPRETRLTWSAVVSVVTVQIVMVGFIISALWEKDTIGPIFKNKERKKLRNFLRDQVTEEAYREPEVFSLFQEKKNQ
jgi:hypothetical protein